MLVGWFVAAAHAGGVMVFAEGHVGCALSVDGKYVGSVPANVELQSGRHAFVVHCPDAVLKEERDVALPATGSIMVKLDKLAPAATGAAVAVQIRSKTTGAMISVDSGMPAPGPLSLKLAPGPHVFVVADAAGTAKPPVTVTVSSDKPTIDLE